MLWDRQFGPVALHKLHGVPFAWLKDKTGLAVVAVPCPALAARRARPPQRQDRRGPGGRDRPGLPHTSLQVDAHRYSLPSSRWKKVTARQAHALHRHDRGRAGQRGRQQPGPVAGEPATSFSELSPAAARRVKRAAGLTAAAPCQRLARVASLPASRAGHPHRGTAKPTTRPAWP